MKPLYTIIDQIFVSGGSFLTIAISAQFFPVSEQGKFGYIIATYLGIVVINTTLLFQWATIQSPKENDQKEFRRRLAGYQLSLAIVSSAAGCLLLWLLGKGSGWSLKIIDNLAIYIFLFFQQLADFDRRSSYLFFNAKRAAKISVAVYVARIFLLIIVGPNNVVALMFIMGLTAFISAIRVIDLGIRDSVKLGQSLSLIKEQSPSAKWLMASGPLVWAAGTMPVYFLGLIAGLTAVGVFVTIRSLTNAANVAMEILETEVATRAARFSVSKPEEYRLLFKKVNIIGGIFWAVGCAVLVMWGGEILKFIYGSSYSKYNSLLLVLWLATGITFAYRVNAVRLRTSEKSKIVTVAYLFSVAAILASAYPLIIYFGVAGAALLVCVGVTANYISQWLICRLTLNIRQY